MTRKIGLCGLVVEISRLNTLINFAQLEIGTYFLYAFITFRKWFVSEGI